MLTLTANLTARARRDSFQGRDYLVAPLTLIVEGVLPGSRGPLLYPAEEISANVQAWNGVPLVIKHPYLDGKPISARQPSVLDKQGVGVVLNAVYDAGKLKAEAWFDLARLRKVANGTIASVERGQKIELSTGLFTDNEPAEAGAVWNGNPYHFVARNYRPDHVAILLDQTGACSIADGCGVNVNQRRGDAMNEKERKQIVDELIANTCCWDAEDREELEGLTDNQLNKLKENADKDKQRTAVHNAAVKGFTDPGGNDHTWNEKTQKWESKVKEPPKKEETKKEETVTTNEQKPKPITEEDLPASMREDLLFARTEKERQRTNLISELTANVEDKEAKAMLADNLKDKSLTDLRALRVLAPKNPAEVTANYAGAAGGRDTTGKSTVQVIGLPNEYL